MSLANRRPAFFNNIVIEFPNLGINYFNELKEAGDGHLNYLLVRNSQTSAPSSKILLNCFTSTYLR